MNEIKLGDVLEVLRTLEDNSVDMGVTSPPYNKKKNKKGGLVKDIKYTDIEDHLPEDQYQEEQIEILNELYRVIKPGGTLALTTPNQKWFFALVIANILRIRKYKGLENWSSWKAIDLPIIANNLQISKKMGIHALPFYQKQIYPIEWADI